MCVEQKVNRIKLISKTLGHSCKRHFTLPEVLYVPYQITYNILSIVYRQALAIVLEKLLQSNDEYT